MFSPQYRSCKFTGGTHNNTRHMVDVRKETWTLIKRSDTAVSVGDTPPDQELELYLRVCRREGLREWFEYEKEPPVIGRLFR